MKKGDRVRVHTGLEGMVMAVYGNNIRVRHLCARPLGIWDCYTKEYEAHEVRPLSLPMRIYRCLFPGLLCTQQFTDHGE